MPARGRSNAYTIHNNVRIVRGGADYFDAIEQLADNARYSIHLQTYIFDEDETGKKVAEALIRAARRKVLVYILVDGYASQDLSPAFISHLRESCVHFSFFEPMLRSDHFYFGRRLHHNVVVDDAQVCIVAGLNISNRYNDMGATHAWLDWAVCAEGEIAHQLNEVCIKIWDRSVVRKKCIATRPPAHPSLPAEECRVRVRRNDWVYRKTQITRSYRELFHHAQKNVTVMTSYFWPPQKLLRLMAAASARGVQVRLILTAKADVPFAKYTERYLYSWLFRHNIEIYEYEKNVLHGKVAIRDDEWITAGSYNVNNISAYASVELNLDIWDTALAHQLTVNMQHIIDEDCERVTAGNFAANSNLLKRFLYYLSYRVVHVTFFLFTFYFVQRRDQR